jgi:hypothetical protein
MPQKFVTIIRHAFRDRMETSQFKLKPIHIGKLLLKQSKTTASIAPIP